MGSGISKCGLISKWTVFMALISASTGCMAKSCIIPSPDGNIQVAFYVDTERGVPFYSIQLAGKEVLKPSLMGLVRNDSSFVENLILDKMSDLETVNDTYSMFTGKKKNCTYQAHRRIFTVKNSGGQAMDIIFQVSNDGVAFRYAFGDKSDKTCTIKHEMTAFAFADDTLSWLHPMQPGKSGWARTQPSYEEHYEIEKPVGRPSPTGQGWCFPALFKTAAGSWVLICDSDVDGSYCAARLADDSAGGVYHIAFPHPEEHRGTIDPVEPQIQLPFTSPWRVLIIGQDLNTIVESTLMTDVASPCKLKNTSFIKPGKAAWHWLRYGDDSSTLPVAQSFLDFAAQMHWEYILIDASWDVNIGYEKMADFVRQAAAKKVDVILWYNSNGPWNDAPMSPKNKMHESKVRREEFAKLQKMGVKGVKVDFFGGDKQATVKLYLDILNDAADCNILVNCHGATIPRGWQRTYPNLVSMEAVMGMEYNTFDQKNTDQEPQHCCMLPFTRNAIGSMDYTPTVLDPKIRGVRLVTTPAFEIALPVIFESGVQHLGLVPDEIKLLSSEVKTYLQEVPTVWDETRFIDGYPGSFVVMARHSGSVWYVAGINGKNEEKQLTLDLSVLGQVGKNMMLLTDGPNRTFAAQPVTSQKLDIKLQPNGGFVLIAK